MFKNVVINPIIMKEKDLLKIALICSLLGILLLLFISTTLQVNKKSISKIDETDIGYNVRVNGMITNIQDKGTVLLLEVAELGKMNVVIFNSNLSLNNGDYIEITAVPKGFGSEAKSSLVFIVTSESMGDAITRCVIDNAIMSLGENCPPTIVGLGIGGTGDIAMHLAKKALFRTPLGSPNPDPIVAKLEARILKALNNTGLGPMAVGGNTTSLAVHAEICGTHTAVSPVGITYQCWAARYSTARIYPDGKVEYITHPKTEGQET